LQIAALHSPDPGFNMRMLIDARNGFQDGAILRTQRIYCVSHEPPLVPESLFDHAIGIGEYRPTRGAHVSALDPFWDRMRQLAYGAAGNYVIPRAMDVEACTTDVTGIFSHRKIVVRSSIGRAALKYPVYREISVAVASELSIIEVHPREESEFLIGGPLHFPQGIISQYAQMHHAIDLICYLSIAAEIGVLTAAELREFSLDTMFVPGGCELGVYPTDWLRATLGKLERLGREFVTRCGDRISTYDRYQVRAVGFLAERLGSYFLLKELRSRFPEGIPTTLIGSLCVIVPEGAAYAGATATG
jgi:hypothetical protein